MARVWDISAEELEDWACKYEAASVLPALVRKLLLATTRLRRIDMRAGGGVWLAGWGGIVDAEEPSPFCPSGRSGWELSTAEPIRSKLDEDFRKRSSQASADLAAYVAVTARRFSGKKRWLEDKRGKGPWTEVRLLDADDLAMWRA